MKQILCFGDSNTYGLIPGTGNRYDWNIRWTGILDKNLGEKGYRIIEEGLCGRTTVFDDSLREGRKGVDTLPTLLESHNPIDIVILMLGTNDCKTVYNATAEIIGKGIQRLLEQIKQKAPQAKIILVSPIHLGQGVWEEGFDSEFDDSSVETSENLHKVYNRIADENEIYYLRASGYANPSPLDREHLDENGHRKLAEGLLDLLEGVITDGY
ncbi:MAG: arylesterase [Lachnospiraceae bacterium]|nr:arylesterase [Lachnospiraceae bacterium]